MVVMFLIMYIFAIVMTDQVMKQGDVDQYVYSRSALIEKPWLADEYWGTVPRSLFSLFQIVTLDHWCSSLMRPLVARYPSYAFLILIFMIITIMSLLNVIVGAIVESTLASASKSDEKTKRETAKVHHRIMNSLKEVFEEADLDESGELDQEELDSAYHLVHVRERLKLLGLHRRDLQMLFYLLDVQGTGAVNTNTFFRGCTRLQGLAMNCDLHHMSVDFTRYANWCNDMANTHHEANDRLAHLLFDIEGLDRDIVKGHHDAEDPVLMARRGRFRKVEDARREAEAYERRIQEEEAALAKAREIERRATFWEGDGPQEDAPSRRNSGQKA